MAGNDFAQTQPETGGRRGNGMAIAALVLGIVAILLFWTVFGGVLLGLLALIFGIIGARRARGGRAPHRTMSIIGAVLGTLGMIASVVIIAIGASILNSDEFKNFNDCVEHADTQSERDACAEDFNKDMNN
ncbi:DUF4190 domain-containing protein [Streptomyces sp. 15-116A]|uniref:DUF4190 domain-containing protein n=1 Tax=Streptomyces sp. 15-116A TaxID=2259035 RepID=UPI0021B3755E|nr:DUF4190 domain-containing protein [Streptomyces sp. 15-116A]MCT7354240.1 DUF4190 domain-containing protein [Streptomyces sp. 15-116A]